MREARRIFRNSCSFPCCQLYQNHIGCHTLSELESSTARIATCRNDWRIYVASKTHPPIGVFRDVFITLIRSSCPYIVIDLSYQVHDHGLVTCWCKIVAVRRYNSILAYNLRRPACPPCQFLRGSMVSLWILNFQWMWIRLYADLLDSWVSIKMVLLPNYTHWTQ